MKIEFDQTDIQETIQMDIQTVIIDTVREFVNDHPELEQTDTEMVFGETEDVGVGSTSTEVLVDGKRFEIRIVSR